MLTGEPAKGQDALGRKYSILFFGTQMAMGGAQKLLLDQARWFHAHGHRVTAAFFYDKQGLQEVWQDGLGFRLLTLTTVGPDGTILDKAGALAIGLFRLWGLLRRGHFDVIETFTYDSNLLALPLAWLAGVRVRIATHHGIIEGFPRWIERLHAGLTNLGIASVLVSVSDKTREQAALAGTNPGRIRVIPNGIPPVVKEIVNRSELRREVGMESNGVLLISVGRLVYQKGHEFLIRALPAVLRQFPNTRVCICGEGRLRRQLETEITELKLSDKIRLMGNRNDVAQLLECADIFVLPSRWEGLPVALLEAMGTGLSVVATRVEGVEEVVQDDVQGLLVPPEDSDALAAALVQLISSPELRRRMGEAATRRIAGSYTIDIMCEKYLSVIHNIASMRGARQKATSGIGGR